MKGNSQVGVYGTIHMTPEQLQDCGVLGAMSALMPGGDLTMAGLLPMLRSENTGTPRISWQREVYVNPRYQMVAEAPACGVGTATPLYVQNAGNLVPGVLLLNNVTHEQVRVLSAQGNMIMVARGSGNMMPQAVPASSYWVENGTAYEQGAVRPIPRSSSAKESFYNFTQIQRHSWAVTGTASATTVNGEHPKFKNPRDAALAHAQSLETQILFGQASVETVNGQELTTSDGIISMLRKHAPGNVINAPGVVTFEGLEDMLDRVFEHGSSSGAGPRRVIISGSQFKKVINRLGRYSGQTHLTPGQTNFGLRFSSFTTSHGDFQILEHPMFNTRGMQGSALILDMGQIVPVYMPGRKTVHRKFNMNINADAGSVDDNGIDSSGGELLTEMSLKMPNPETAMLINGLCEAACQPCKPLPDLKHAKFWIDPQACFAPCSEVTLRICGTATATTFNILGPAGAVSITTDAQGNGSAKVKLPVWADLGVPHNVSTTFQPIVSFNVVLGSDQMNIHFAGLSAAVRICNPCDTNLVITEPDCPVICEGVKVPQEPLAPKPTCAPTPIPTPAPTSLL